jgi:N-acetylmuramoyl-L-alanine amidase
VRTPHKILGAICAATLFAQAVPAADWKVIRQNQRDYVSFANVAQFYRFPEYTRASRTVSLRGERRGIRAQAGTSELFINGVRFYTDFPLIATNDDNLISAMDVNKIIEPVLRPSKIPGAQKVTTVILDPGHGGTDGGASNRWGSEKGYSLDVALTAREQLLRAGYKVEMTRSTDVGVSLEQRVSLANQFPHAVFVSIHFNSSNGGSGVESYSLAPAGVPSNASSENHPSAADVQPCAGNGHDSENVALTAAVHASVLSKLAVFDRGVRHARFHVLRETKVPAVLVECGFLSDPVEGQRIATLQYRQQLGVAIAQAVENYSAAVSFQSPTATIASAARNLPPHQHSIAEPLDAAAPKKTESGNQPSIVISGAE